ncbi:MAG: nucleotidyltransferase family protein [Acidimicrobiia bacterium]|nr:nucleotidyltransferase family protein [Acidimicrobiia bacterium]
MTTAIEPHIATISGSAPGDAALFVARHGWRDEGPRTLDAIEVSNCESQWLLGLVERGVLEGGLVLDHDADAILRSRALAASMSATTLESRGGAAIAALRDAGIGTRVIKGVAIAHLDYDDPGDRHFGDIDVLVHGSDIAASVAVLEQAGFRRHYPEPTAGFDEHLGKGVALENDEQVVIDVHRTLALGYYGTRLPIERLWDRPQPMAVGDIEVTTMPRLNRFLHCAIHMSLSPSRRISSGLDMCMIATRGGGIDPDEAIERSIEWGCDHLLAEAVRATIGWFPDALPIPRLTDWARKRPRSTRDRILAGAYSGRFAGSRLRSLTAIAGVPTLRGRASASRYVLHRNHDAHK